MIECFKVSGTAGGSCVCLYMAGQDVCICPAGAFRAIRNCWYRGAHGEVVVGACFEGVPINSKGVAQTPEAVMERLVPPMGHWKVLDVEESVEGLCTVSSAIMRRPGCKGQPG